MAGVLAGLSFVVLPGTAVADTAGGATDKPVTIVALGDSLTAGYNLPPSAAFPVQLQSALKGDGFSSVRVLNAGVSGDTTAGGLARFDWAVPDTAEAVILELGANDALRGLPVADAKRNLAAILDKLKARDLPVLISGVPSLSNWGPDYERDFSAMFVDLAKTYDAVFHKNFLEGVVGNRALIQPDGLHPTADGVAVMVKNIKPRVLELLARVRTAKTN